MVGILVLARRRAVDGNYHRIARTETMAIDPEELLPRKKPAGITLGEDLSLLSEFELSARIMAMEEEIARCRHAIGLRQATKSAADSIFKR
jgi:uncharacterized small protein (DUF1192 family)